MIRFENVSLRYDNNTDVLQNINFELKPGSFHFLTGSSGAGKTSLLKLIFLAGKPSGGKVFLFNQDSARLPRAALPEIRRRIGVVFQEFRLLDHLTLYENVSLPLRVCNIKETQYRSNILELMNWVGLGDRVNAFPTTLSGGEQQRAALARALAPEPALLLMDEPFSSLDQQLRDQMRDLTMKMLRGSAPRECPKYLEMFVKSMILEAQGARPHPENAPRQRP